MAFWWRQSGVKIDRFFAITNPNRLQFAMIGTWASDLIELQALTNNEFDEEVLVRFLKARNGNIKQAAVMIKAYKTWRGTYDVDGLKIFRFFEFDAVQKIYPRAWHKTDKLGRPVLIMAHANVTIEKLWKVTNQERFIKFHVRENEKLQHYRLEACSKARRETVNQVVAVMDLKGFSMLEVGRGIGLIREIGQIDADYYPEMMGKILVINAHPIFSSFWGIFKQILPAETVKKITILGNCYYEVLRELVDDENIPEYLGGKSKVHSDDFGPWNDGNTLGYPIQEFEDYEKLDRAAAMKTK